jgi:hypothetical protein
LMRACSWSRRASGVTPRNWKFQDVNREDN